MSLSVEMPPPPTLAEIDPNQYEDAEVIGDTDYRREELQLYLSQGAWEAAWSAWAEDTRLTAEDWQIVEDLDLLHQFDFFWDAFAERVGYHAPGIPEDWRERELHEDLESWGTVSAINAGLTELGQTVCDVLKDEYIEWETEYEPPEDLPDFS